MRLLISVLSPEEAAAAVTGGADIIDVKNPAEGALGAPSPGTLRAIRRVVPWTTPLSVALGDAPHLPGTLALAAHGAAGCGVDFVKVGLLGSRHPRQALELLTAVRLATEDTGPRVGVVAVAYADSARAGGLPAPELPAVAAAAGAAGVMLDTFFKDGTCLFDALEESAVGTFVHAARSAGLLVGLAGALGQGDLPRVRRLGVDVVGVRGSACEGGRGGVVGADRVRSLRDRLRLSIPASPAPSPARAGSEADRGSGR